MSRNVKPMFPTAPIVVVSVVIRRSGRRQRDLGGRPAVAGYDDQLPVTVAARSEPVGRPGPVAGSTGRWLVGRVECGSGRRIDGVVVPRSG
jgi:hypothetical protein